MDPAAFGAVDFYGVLLTPAPQVLGCKGIAREDFRRAMATAVWFREAIEHKDLANEEEKIEKMTGILPEKIRELIKSIDHRNALQSQAKFRLAQRQRWRVIRYLRRSAELQVGSTPTIFQRGSPRSDNSWKPISAGHRDFPTTCA